MNCPFCENVLIQGNLKLRSSHIARLLFSPLEINEGFVEKWLPGSLFDNKLKNGENEILRMDRPPKRNVRIEAYKCENCKKIIIDY